MKIAFPGQFYKQSFLFYVDRNEVRAHFPSNLECYQMVVYRKIKLLFP